MYFRDSISRSRSPVQDESPVHIHLHGSSYVRDQEAVSMGEDPEGEISSRLEALEAAVIMLVGEDDETQDDSSVEQTMASQRTERQRVSETMANQYGKDSDADVPSPPPSPSEINEKNAKAWKRDTDSTTGGSGSLAPNSRKAEGGGYMPNQAGSINPRLSKTSNTLDPGRTFGVTQDSLQRAAIYKAQMQKANRQINGLNAKNAQFWRRGA